MHAMSFRSMYKTVSKPIEILSVSFWVCIYPGYFLRDKNKKYFSIILYWFGCIGTEVKKRLFWLDFLVNYQHFLVAYGLNNKVLRLGRDSEWDKLLHRSCFAAQCFICLELFLSLILDNITVYIILGWIII